jgi:hypothetical protein
VIRVRSRQRAGEPVGPLIEDPWRRYPCSQARTAAGSSSRSRFRDRGRDVSYRPCGRGAVAGGDMGSCAASTTLPASARVHRATALPDQLRGRLPRHERGTRLVVSDLRELRR